MMDSALQLIQMNLDAGREAIEDVRQAYIDLGLNMHPVYGQPSAVEVSKHVCNYARDQQERIAALQAENARLRLALEHIEHYAPKTRPEQHSYTVDYAVHCDYWVAGCLAREALRVIGVE